MKHGWLLYDQQDYNANRMFAAHMQKCATPHALEFSVVFSKNIESALEAPPDFVVSRQRDPQLSRRLEALGIPVFNPSRVCEICNDKRNTHRFVRNFPHMQTISVSNGEAYIPNEKAFPLVVKPTMGHGGDRVTMVVNQAELHNVLAAIHPQPALVQEMASEAGRDLRVYVLFGKIIAAVMRTAHEGIVSNYKKGGDVRLHRISMQERELAEQLIRHFADADAPLAFAGIDMIYHHGQPVINEVEDVVGSRMLYKVSDIDILSLYVQGIADRLLHDKTGNL